MKHKFFKPEAYAVFAAAFLSNQISNGQVIVNDYDPDLRMMNWTGEYTGDDTVQIDINDNGIYDLIFEYNTYIDADVLLDVSDAVISVLGYDGYVAPLGTGDIIDEGIGSWLPGTNLLRAFNNTWNFTSSSCITSSFGLIGVNDYIGLKLNLSGETHYGWVRLSARNIVDYSCDYYRIGSPLTIYEAAYNQTGNEPIICNANVKKEVVNGVFDYYDTENISEFRVQVNPPDIIDFQSLRFYLVSDRGAALNFSVEDALALPATNYFTMPADAINPDEVTYLTVPAYVLDTEGHPFDPDKYYALFSMVIPMEGDDANLTLSSPSSIIQGKDQACILEMEETDFLIENITQTENGYNFILTFPADADESDISGYKVGLYDESDVENIDELNFVEGAYQPVAKTGAAEYTVYFSDLQTTIDGKPLTTNNVYYPIIYAEGDGAFRDDACYRIGLYTFYYLGNETLIKNDLMSLVQYGDALLINIDASLLNKNNRIQITNLSGQKILSQDLTNEESEINLNKFISGIYIATLYSDNVPVLASKISILH